MSAAITILRTGFFTSIQDEGRSGYGHLGTPVSGALDKYAYRLANVLLNNTTNEAQLECTLVGPDIQFHKEVYFVVTGASAVAMLDTVKVRMGVPTLAQKNQILSITKIVGGSRCYVSFAGGILSDIILNSKSWMKPITPLASVEKGMRFKTGLSHYGGLKQATVRTHKEASSVKQQITSVIEASRGPEYHKLSLLQKEKIKNTVFTVSNLWNRMAIQLKELIDNDIESMYSSPVMPGIVQLTPSGSLVILTNDCQTTGGYPRVLFIKPSGLNRLSQMQQGNRLLLAVT